MYNTLIIKQTFGCLY